MLDRASFFQANLTGAILTSARLSGASFYGARLNEANLVGTDLPSADLKNADLSRANLSEARLRYATLVETILTDSDLNHCQVYGISAWNLKVSKGTKQKDLVINAPLEPDESSIPHELATVGPFLRTTPVVLLRLAGATGYSMIKGLEAYSSWVVHVREYADPGALIDGLDDHVLAPAEAKLRILRPDPTG